MIRAAGVWLMEELMCRPELLLLLPAPRLREDTIAAVSLLILLPVTVEMGLVREDLTGTVRSV